MKRDAWVYVHTKISLKGGDEDVTSLQAFDNTINWHISTIAGDTVTKSLTDLFVIADRIVYICFDYLMCVHQAVHLTISVAVSE